MCDVIKGCGFIQPRPYFNDANKLRKTIKLRIIEDYFKLRLINS